MVFGPSEQIVLVIDDHKGDSWLLLGSVDHSCARGIRRKDGKVKEMIIGVGNAQFALVHEGSEFPGAPISFS